MPIRLRGCNTSAVPSARLITPTSENGSVVLETTIVSTPVARMRVSTTIPAAMLVNGYAQLSNHLVSFRPRSVELCRKFGCTSNSSWSPIVSSCESADPFSLTSADAGNGGSPLEAAAGARSLIGGRRVANGATIQYQNALMATGASVTSTRIQSASTNTLPTEPRNLCACR